MTDSKCLTPPVRADAWLKRLCFVFATANLMLFFLQSPKSHNGWTTLIAFTTTVVAFILFFAGHGLARKPLQFRLSTMLCMAASFAIPLGWLTHDITEAKKQEIFLANVSHNRGSWYRYDVSPVELRKGANRWQRWLWDIFGHDFFANVEWLDIAATDSGFERLADLRNLTGVNLRACKITDDDLRFCRDQPYLKHICLDDTPITDDGLNHLIPLKELEELWLRNTRVTQRGVLRLKRELPSCRVHTSFPNKIR